MSVQSTQGGWRLRLPTGLPRLHGWRRRLFLLIWCMVLLACFLAAVISAPLYYENSVAPISPVPAAGLSVDEDAPWVTLGPPVGPEAKRAGLHRGDRLVAIDGRPVARDWEGLDSQLQGPVGTRVTVTTQSLSGALTRHALTRTPEHYLRAMARAGLGGATMRISINASNWLFSYVLPLTCALILMVRRARDRLAPWASFSMLLFALTVGPAGYGIALHAPLLFPILYVVATTSNIGILAVFPEDRFNPRWSLAVIVAAAIVAVVTFPLSPAQTRGARTLVQFAAVAAIGVRYKWLPPGTGRQQIRWALLGFAVSLLFLMLATLVGLIGEHTEDFGFFKWTQVGTAVLFSCTQIQMIAITVALLRYRLYDSDVTISRSLIYGSLSLALLGIFAGSEKLIEVMGEEWFGARLGALASGLAAGIAAICIGPLHHRVTHWVEKRFRTGLVHLREGLPPLIADLRENASPAALADTVLERVERGARARHGAIVIAGEVLRSRDISDEGVNSWLDRNPLGADTILYDRSDPEFPLRTPLRADGPGLVGWLLLGPRPDGSAIGGDERDALRVVADAVARGLAITLERQGREAARQNRDAERDQEIAQLRGLIRRIEEQLGLSSPSSKAIA